MKVMNIFWTKTYKLTWKEKVPIIKNWLGREGLEIIETFTNSRKEAWKTVGVLFSTLG